MGNYFNDGSRQSRDCTEEQGFKHAGSSIVGFAGQLRVSKSTYNLNRLINYMSLTYDTTENKVSTY